MTDDPKQAVVDNPDPAARPDGSPTGEGGGAQEPTLEQLLDEYDRSVQRPSPQPDYTPQYQQPQEPQTPPVDYSRVQRLEQKLFLDEVNETADKIFGELEVPQKAKIGWLDQMAREIPQAAAAFTARHSSPKASQQWAKWERYLSKAVHEEFKAPVDREATGDREAVAAAVRGASTRVTTEPPPKFGGMSNSQFRKSVIDQYGFDPGV